MRTNLTYKKGMWICNTNAHVQERVSCCHVENENNLTKGNVTPGKMIMSKIEHLATNVEKDNSTVHCKQLYFAP